MQARKFDELISYFNRKVAEMSIDIKYKMELLGMVTALGLTHEKELTEQPERQWIPVTERLPEKEKKSYWVCLESGGQCQCRWTNDIYGVGVGELSTWGWNIFDKPQYSKVVAWMPLPKPWGDTE